MLHIRLKPQVGRSEQDEREDQAEIVARKQRIAKIAEGNHEDTGGHHQGGMQKSLREREDLMNHR